MTVIASKTMRRAFTLIELLIAMAMVGIVALALFASLGIAFKSRAAAERNVEPSRTVSLAMDLICKDIEAAQPPGGTLSNGWLGLTDSSTSGTTTGATGTTGSAASASTSTFVSPMSNTVNGSFEGFDQTDDHGNPGDDLRFFTTAQSPTRAEGANGDMKYVELTTVASQDGSDMLLVCKVYNNLLSQVSEDPDVEVICRGVAGFNLRYWDPVVGEWEDTWDCSQYSNGLPAAIEVTLQLQRPDATGQMQVISFQRVVSVHCAVAYSLLPSTSTTATGG
jgi:prepilin-type N-terminal cleavage/methylation domain-containing protein